MPTILKEEPAMNGWKLIPAHSKPVRVQIFADAFQAPVANLPSPWRANPPIVIGWYAWRLPGKPPHPHLARIYEEDGELRADMKAEYWEHDYALSELANREWFGPLPE